MRDHLVIGQLLVAQTVAEIGRPFAASGKARLEINSVAVEVADQTDNKRAHGLLQRNPSPTEADIKSALSANLCGCGTHLRIVRAVQRAAKVS